MTYLELAALRMSSCENARRLIQDELRARPDVADLHSSLGRVYALLGQDAEAIREGRRAVALRPLSRHATANLDYLVALAEIYATVGQQEAAVEELERLLSIPSPISVPTLRTDPIWDPLRENPRFSEMLARYEDANETR